MINYWVVLFKNKKRKKIINKFVTLEKANQFFEKYKSNSDEIIFGKEIVNGYESEYEIGLILVGKPPEGSVYLKDTLGRSIKVELENENMTLLKIYPIKIEEFLYDFQTKRKISFKEILKSYLKIGELKIVFNLNNKIVIQQDDDIKIILSKTQKEAFRFLECLSNYFFEIKRKDCMVVKDTSIAQKKYLYKFLESKGFEKSFLYRKSTFQVQSK